MSKKRSNTNIAEDEGKVLESADVEAQAEAVPTVQSEEAPTENVVVGEAEPVISQPDLVTTQETKTEEPEGASIKGRMAKGKLVKLVKEPIYQGPKTLLPVKYLTGNYFIYDGIERCGRYRICKARTECGKGTSYIVGYINP
jgi:hypothetical protein